MKWNRPEQVWVRCVRSEGDFDLTLGKRYAVIRDKHAEEVGFLRIVDDSGDDYLHAAGRFRL